MELIILVKTMVMLKIEKGDKGHGIQAVMESRRKPQSGKKQTNRDKISWERDFEGQIGSVTALITLCGVMWLR